uniref:Nuclear receptor n=1 Tax=Parastrongyloides trichosuri TaxID=131310 RepID=A0A0N4ZI30_PARTI
MDDDNVCLVCGVETKSIHCQVNSCRACSSFFSRGETASKLYRCRKGNKKCEIKPGDKLFCKYCRYQKCLSVGMVIKRKVIHNVSLSPQQRTISEVHYIEKSLVKENVMKLEIIGNKIVFDSDDLKNRIGNIFKNNYMNNKDNYGFYLTCLQEVILGIEFLRTKMITGSKDDIKINNRVPLTDHLNYRLSGMISIANFLMKIKDFTTISMAEKWILLKNFWFRAFTFLRTFFSIHVFGITNPKQIMLIDDCQATENHIHSVTEPSIDAENLKKITEISKPLSLFHDENILEPMRKLNLDQTEGAYFLIQLLFSKANISGLTKNTKDMCDKIIDISNNELHNYYVYTKNINNYCFRVTEITKLIFMVHEYDNREREVILLSKFFSVLDASLIEEI